MNAGCSLTPSIAGTGVGYVCLGDHVGFDVVNLETGKVPHRVFAGDEPIPHRTHGAALTPDEKELWISDQQGRKLFIFDATRMPPEPKGHVELSQGGHGWVCFSLDGQYAWSHTPDVFDARTKKLVATLKDENGNPCERLEVHRSSFPRWQSCGNGQRVWTRTQIDPFGGRSASVPLDAATCLVTTLGQNLNLPIRFLPFKHERSITRSVALGGLARCRE